MATHSGILTREIPRTEEPGRLQSIVLQSRTRLSMRIHRPWDRNNKNKFLIYVTTWKMLNNIWIKTKVGCKSQSAQWLQLCKTCINKNKMSLNKWKKFNLLEWLECCLFLCILLELDSFPGGSDGKEFACSVGDLGLIPGWEDPLEKGTGYPLQYSGLENSIDRGAWQATVHGVTRGRTNEWL